MKKLALALMLIATPASASKLDITPFIDRLQGSYVYNQHGDHMAGAHYKAFEYPAKGPWASANAGVIWNAGGKQSGIGGAFASVSFKVDKVGNWVWNKSGMRGKVKMNFKIPAFDLGPMGGYVQRLGWIYGVHIAKGFGG